jgi:Zn finger protein HypA/HybF involved in hydrogenase expression
MHEMSVAMEICRIAGERLGPDDAALLSEIGVEVGDTSGLEPSSLEFCLEALLSEPPFRGARANIIAGAGDVLRVNYLEVDDERPRH